MRSFFYVLALIVVIGCSDSEEKNVDYTESNNAEILKYIEENSLNMTQTSSGLYYVITKDFDGETKPTSSDNVTVTYKGYFTDGIVFDESEDSGSTFNINLLIPGFSEGIKLLTEGDEATLILPSKLAYGNKSVGTIPVGSVLVFDVKLISINKK